MWPLLVTHGPDSKTKSLKFYELRVVLPVELGVCVKISNPVELGILAVRTLNVTFFRC